MLIACYSLLYTYAAAGTNAEISEAVDDSLTKIDISIDDAPQEIMINLCSDSGGGGTREGLENKLIEHERTCSFDLFIATTCAHHTFNLMVASLYTKFFGDGRI